MTAALTLASLALLLFLLMQGRWTAAVLFAVWAGGFFLLGIIRQDELLASFSNPALVTLLLLLMASLVLERSSLLERLTRGLLRGSERMARLRLMATVATMSAFLNNTAVVAAFLGLISRQKAIPSGRLLMGLSYGAILGGVITLVGTSTNLVVSSFMVAGGLPPLGMFDLAWVGIPAAIAGIVVHALLPDGLSRRSHQHAPAECEDEDAARPYFLQARVIEGSKLAGRSIAENGLRHLDGLYLLEIERSARLISPVGPEEVLEEGDHLLFTGDVRRVQVLQTYAGLEVFGTRSDDLLQSNLLEVVISSESDLAGQTLRDVDFRTMFDAGVVGIRRGAKRLTGQLGRIPLCIGDCLLLAVGQDFAQHRNVDRHFHMLGDVPLRPQLSLQQGWVALAGFGAVIAGSAADYFSLLQGLLVLLTVFLATRMLTVAEMRRRFPFELWVLIGSALALAQGLERSGAANLMATGMQTLFGDAGVYWALVGVYLLTLLLTELITNNAAAALAFPIALATARSFGVDPTAFVFIVLYGASAGFLIPSGYQTHLMVMTVGRYTTRNFVKAGLPVSLAYSAVVLTLTPWVFPLTPS
ncbi:MAG: SLC13 family permease [Betaproteobacteria bacterium HGW-Betaproteobacteria-16]|nr:MAG: SLC13 family permease [Betaproteobacteria bacterium HGW-Betaproteobacteria-16]